MTERAEIEVGSAAELAAWLRHHHRQREAVWLISYKKAAGARYLPYDRLVEELLAWGWVDSKPGRVDALRSKLLIAPRNPASAWSKANRDRIARLEAEGRMQAPGRAVVEEAKANGGWDRLRQAESGRAPSDLAAALKAVKATGGWRNFTLATRKRALEWMGSAKSEETRARRIAAIVAGAADGRDPTAWTPKR